MKKYFYLLAMALFATQFQFCSSSDDDDAPAAGSELEQKYFTIENAVYNPGNFPAATMSETLNGVDMSTQVMNGAMNFITVVTDQQIQKFFVGVQGAPGYYEYTASAATRAGNLNSYTIPMMMSQSYRGTSTLMLSGQLQGGGVTAPIQKQMFYIETMPGAIEVKLAFSNSKDVDLHLYTPSGEHIYYGHRGGTKTINGEEVSYGLDIDSNAGCNIDGKNKENIYLPAELVESGTYKVVVDMYKNCDKETSTSWSIIARYQGEPVRVTSGTNPASGVYPVGAGDGDMTTVMTFTIDGATTRGVRHLSFDSFEPIPLSDMDMMKMEEAEFEKQFKK